MMKKDRFGEITVAITLVVFVLYAVMIAPLGSVQMYGVLIYIFLPAVVGGIIYIVKSRGAW